MNTKTGRVIVISGGICSGKSRVAACLSQKLQCSIGSFGNAVRSIATARGIEHTRDYLQTLGEEMVGSKPEDLCEAMLSLANWSKTSDLVVEGMRHKHMMDLLRSLVLPSSSKLVFLDVSKSVRQDRLLLRDGKGDLEELEKHSTERQVLTELLQAADHIIDGDRDSNSVCEDILNALR